MANGDRPVLPPENAGTFALVLLRADATTDGREQVVALNDRGRGFEITRGDLADEVVNLDPDRTAGDAHRASALETTHRFQLSHLRRKAQVHLLEILRSLGSIDFRHLRRG